MKNFIINFFRNYPVCTGLLSLLITLHLVGVKNLQTPLVAMQKNLFPLFFFYVVSMLGYMLFILPKIDSQKQEKITWIVIAVMVVVLTIIAKFFMA